MTENSFDFKDGKESGRYLLPSTLEESIMTLHKLILYLYIIIRFIQLQVKI